MDARFFNGLYEGDSPNGAKLGMGLTGGDFWPRPMGCLNLYRGPRWWEVDFDTITAVADANAERVVATIESAPGQPCFFAPRPVNGCGEDTTSLSTIIRAVFDGAGDLLPPAGRNVIALSARRIAQSTVRLMWLYVPYHAPAQCTQFNIYSDGAAGVMNLHRPVAIVHCSGPGIYSCDCRVSQPGRHRFCLRCQSPAGLESFDTHVAADVATALPETVNHLTVKVI